MDLDQAVAEYQEALSALAVLDAEMRKIAQEQVTTQARLTEARQTVSVKRSLAESRVAELEAAVIAAAREGR